MEDLYNQNLHKWLKVNLVEPSLMEEVVDVEFPFQKSSDLFNNLNDIHVLYVYGIENDLTFQKIQNWLNEKNDRFVAFIEDDLAKIKAFLKTPTATHLLDHPRAFLLYLDQQKFDFSAYFITARFALMPYLLIATESYKQTKQDTFKQIEHYLFELTRNLYVGKNEFLNTTNTGFLPNYYRNLEALSESKNALALHKPFKNIPAIICGAGPSLDKNAYLLTSLQDKALIFAGGTALNILNGKNIFPHFGVGIDPNSLHVTRLISNTSFETPFFYRPRIFPEALKLVSGEKLWVSGSSRPHFSNWFEKELDISSFIKLDEGFNVVTFNASIAEALGCNPIIFIGVDLAYTDEKSYPSGLSHHALQDPSSTFITKVRDENLYTAKDIYGSPIYTLKKWAEESSWFAYFAKNHPNTKFINATEGGLGFFNIPNSPLKDVIKDDLQTSYDIMGLIHAYVQQSTFKKIPSLTVIYDVLNKHAKNLSSASQLAGDILFAEISLSRAIEEKKDKGTIKEIEEKIKLAIADFSSLEIVKEYLFTYIDWFLKMYFSYHQLIECNPNFNSDLSVKKKRIQFEISLYSHLIEMIQMHSKQVSSAMNQIASKPQKSNEKIVSQTPNQHYSLDVNNLKEVACYYPNENKKSSCYYKNDLLHGPSYFYNEDGKLLSEQVYEEGLKEKTSYFYDLNGSIYAVRNYKKGLFHGLQEYFYPNGTIRSRFSFFEGRLEGKAEMFFEDGTLKRELNFKSGKKDGLERMWSLNGGLLIEAHYKENSPVDIAREWNEQGKLIKEVQYDEETLRRNEKQGIKNSIKDLDYFEQLNHYTKVFENYLNDLLNKFSEEQKSNFIDEINEIKQRIQDIGNVGQKMTALSTIDFGEEGIKEALWKNKEVEKMVRQDIDPILQDLAKKLEKIEQGLNKNLNKE